MNKLFFSQKPKIDIKDILGTKKPLLVFNMGNNGYFNSKNNNDDIKDDKKIEELKKDFSIPYPFPYNNHKEDDEFTNDYAYSSAYKLYSDLQDNINDPLQFPILQDNPTTLCKRYGEKGYGEEIYKKYIQTGYYDSTNPDIILAITKEENRTNSQVTNTRREYNTNIYTSNIFGFAYIDIRKQFVVEGKVLVITAICSAELAKDGKSVKSIGSSLIDSIEKIGKVFNCDAILVNPPARTEGFFKKMGFEKLNGNENFMKLDLHNHGIVHTIVGGSTIKSETGSRKGTGGRKGAGSKKGGKSHKKSRKHTINPHKYTRKSR